MFNRENSISILLDELRINEDQKRRADFTHTGTIDRIIEVYREHLDARESHYEESIEEALNSIGRQVKTIEEEENEKQLFLRTLIFSTKMKHEDDIDKMKTKNLSKLDGLKEENDNVLRMASVILKRRLRNHSEELSAVLRDHEESTKDRRKDFEKLRAKDEQDQKVIIRNSKHIEKLYQMLHSIKTKIFEYRRQSDKEIADCRFERHYFWTAYMTIQNRLLSEQISDRERLKYIITEYNKTEAYLKQCVNTVERILSVVNLCNKYETYEDKLLLYPLSIDIEANCFHSTSIELEHDHTQQLFKENFPLQKFSKPVSKVCRDVINLKRLIKDLDNESNQLKNSLKLYMSEVSRPDSIKKKENISTSPVIIDVKDVLNQ